MRSQVTAITNVPQHTIDTQTQVHIQRLDWVMPPKRRKNSNLIDSFDIDFSSPPRHRVRTIFHDAPSGPKTQTLHTVRSLSPIRHISTPNPSSSPLTTSSFLPETSPLRDTYDGSDDIFDIHMSGTPPPHQPTSYVVRLASKFRKRSTASVDPLKSWLPHASEFLDEMLRSEGRGHYRDSRCMQCGGEEDELLRCRECFGGHLLCQSCTVREHRCLPLHRIEIWVNNSYFKPISLKALGLSIQLGPHALSACPNPTIGHQDFCVMHTNGIHDVRTFFCGCVHAELDRVQLLRVGWYPVTVKDPKTVITFALLRHFHIQTLQSKTAAYDFYVGLIRETNNTGLQKHKDRYHAFMRAVREWRYLIMMKRGGRGHQPTGIRGTLDGELAIQCPACPIPDVNLSDGWQKTPKGSRFLHTLFVAVDANFRLKRKMVSSEAKDPPLAPGKAYFVPPEAYKTHIGMHATNIVTSTCSRLNAVAKANSRDTSGLAVTGVGGCICARHMFMRPNGVGDLQKGERYANMDFIFFSAVATLVISLASIFVSYDIACQWSKNIKKRAEQLPGYLNASSAVPILTFLIPKFHLPGHGSLCQAPYSFNLNIGCARTDGEGIERGWSFMNPVGTATREMGPGSRQDTLEDHWGNMNWTRMVELCSSMEKKLVRAIPELLRHHHQFESFCDSLSTSLITEWTKMVEDWEEDHTSLNPYSAQTLGLTQADVRKELAAEEEKAALSGATALHEVTPTVFLVTGLELEDQQARLKADLGQNSFTTSVQLAKLQERRTALQRQIDNWQAVQTIYMPGLSSIQSGDKHTDEEEIHPEEIQLHLPSSWISRETDCIPGIVEKEWLLRRAQAEEALTNLRQSLCLRAHMVKYKKRNEVRQRSNTRANNLINANVLRTRNHSDRYRHAHKAMVSLDPRRDNWQQTLLVLHDVDIIPLRGGLYDPEEKKSVSKTGEGYRTVSWIWRAPGTLSDDFTPSNEIQKGMHDALRIEWARARARAMRWREEVMLICEEMRRCIRYFEWRVRWWKEKQDLRQEVDVCLQEGICAYALEHAILFEEMGKRCELSWMPFIAVAEHTLTETILSVLGVDNVLSTSPVPVQPSVGDELKDAEKESEVVDSEWNGLQMIGANEEVQPVLGHLPTVEDSASESDDGSSDSLYDFTDD